MADSSSPVPGGSTAGVRSEVHGGVAHIVLARPDVSNAIDIAAATQFGDAIDVAADESVRVVLVRGEGSRFCAGGDVRSMLASNDRAEYLRALASTLGENLYRLSCLDKPVVAAVHGAVAGAGLGFVLAADVTVAARSTKFVMAYSGIGLTPDCGVSYLLPRAIGQQRALEFALTNRTLSADTACDWGLVAEVTDDDELAARADAITATMAEAPPYALGQARRLIRDSFATSRSESLAAEAETISRAVTTPAAVELIDRFAKRA